MMENTDSARIASILAEAPAWAKLGLMDRSAQMRERAAETLGAILAEKLTAPEPYRDDRQLTFL